MQFSPFFVFRPWPKRCFCCFLLFGDARKSIFSVFLLSAAAETLFLLFSAHPSPRKAFFSCFLLIRALGKPFFLFSAHPSPRKAIFLCFLFIRDLGKPFFPVFCSSETSESHFSLFSAHPRPRKAIFLSPPPQRNSDFTDYIAKERKISHIKK